MPLIDGSYGNSLREPSAGVFPLINVTEDANNYYIRAELPGIKADELDISVTGDSFFHFRRKENPRGTVPIPNITGESGNRAASAES